MSERTTVTAGSWTQVGTGPATVQVITNGVPVMVACEASAPATNSDGLVLEGGVANPNVRHTFQLALAIWAQPIAGTAVVACQPE